MTRLIFQFHFLQRLLYFSANSGHVDPYQMLHKCCILQAQIWFYTVCLSPHYGTLQEYISDICALDNFIISRKLEVHPIIFQCWKTFQKCNPPDLKLSLNKYKKISPYGVMLILKLFSLHFYIEKINLELKITVEWTLHHMGKMFLR